MENDDGETYNYLAFQNEERVSQYLKCPICFNIFNNPKRLLLCGHTFCLKCIKSNEMGNFCFQCNQPFKNEHIQTDLIAKKIIDDLRVSCTRTKECRWAGSVQEHRGHIKNKECLDDANKQEFDEGMTITEAKTNIS